jgi:hypothetical protein
LSCLQLSKTPTLQYSNTPIEVETSQVTKHPLSGVEPKPGPPGPDFYSTLRTLFVREVKVD